MGGTLALLAAGLFAALAVSVGIGHEDLAAKYDELGRDVADLAGRTLASVFLFGVAGASGYLGVRQLRRALPLLRFV